MSEAKGGDTRRTHQQIQDAALKALAEKIARDLMVVDGRGEPVDRLVLTRKDGRDMGGWAFGPLTDRILQHLRGEL